MVKKLKYVVIAGALKSKPFTSKSAAYKFARKWEGQFAPFAQLKVRSVKNKR